MEKSDPFTYYLYKKEQEGLSFSYLYHVCLFAACNPTTLKFRNTQARFSAAISPEEVASADVAMPWTEGNGHSWTSTQSRAREQLVHKQAL